MESIKTLLESIGQAHLVAPVEGSKPDDQQRFVDQVTLLNGSYPGGLAGYVTNGKALLLSSQRGDNPFTGCVPSIPNGETFDFSTERFDKLEATGLGLLTQSAFVLVAGGLGERLGYNGIKLELPAETISWTCFIGLYCKYIVAAQAHAAEKRDIPLVIMTSDDTHAKTVALLEANSRFGLTESQLIILKQEKVATLADNDARFTTKAGDPCEIETKPHGHGDIHTLLTSSGLIAKWVAEDRKYVVFLQDTNALVLRSLPAAIGFTAEAGLEVNLMCVPRTAGEAIGGICKVNFPDGTARTLNVEYNQLDPMLIDASKSRGDNPPVGDVAGPDGLSPYPGNINTMIFAVPQYAKGLEKTGGLVPEFVNPKYKDAAKTQFPPTRLECMMQDYPRLVDDPSKVGFSSFPRWLAFSPVKNNLVDGAKKAKSNGEPATASTAEADVFSQNVHVLRSLGVSVAPAAKETHADIPVDFEASVVLMPSFGLTKAEVKSKFPHPEQVTISQRSVLVLDGPDIIIESLKLDGTLIIKAVPGAKVTVRLAVTNKGWHRADLPADTTAFGSKAEQLAIRGYHVVKEEACELVYDTPGTYQVIA